VQKIISLVGQRDGNGPTSLISEGIYPPLTKKLAHYDELLLKKAVKVYSTVHALKCTNYVINTDFRIMC